MDSLDNSITEEQMKAAVNKGACNKAQIRDGIYLDFFDVITSNISFIRGAKTQERDGTAGPEKRVEVCGASSTRSQAIGYRATRTRIQATV